MVKFLLWLILLVVAWPLALLALVLYPIVWLLSIPLKLLGVSVGAILELIQSVLRLPARLLKGPKRYRDPAQTSKRRRKRR